ncbi:hypothetical protein JVU11DRAFT_8166 [Chiua virens]|nr:hypothetical protein JVU11DRAFT_8166 [Chiua virens]
MDVSLHSAFHEAREETYLPRSLDLPFSSFIRGESEERSAQEPVASSCVDTSIREPEVRPASMVITEELPSTESVYSSESATDFGPLLPTSMLLNRKLWTGEETTALLAQDAETTMGSDSIPASVASSSLHEQPNDERVNVTFNFDCDLSDFNYMESFL